MIIKMQKVTLLVSGKNKHEFLARLRKLGVLHIRHMKTPGAAELENVINAISEIKNAVRVLDRYRADSVTSAVMWRLDDIPRNVNEIMSLERERNDIIKSLEDLRNQMAWYKPWGVFDPRDIDALAGKGIFIRLYRAPKSAAKKLGLWKGAHLLGVDKQYAFLALVTENAGDTLPFEAIKPVSESFAELHAEGEDMHRRMEEIDSALRAKSQASDCLRESLSRLEARQTFLEVMHGMKDEDKFSCLTGFCPSESLEGLTVLAKSHGAGYFIEDPDEPEETPTLIRNPGWIGIINPVLKFMNTVPGYNEYDISFWFLLFFSLFFAMLIGDAGYGVLFLAVTCGLRMKFRHLPKEPFFLMYVLSVATIIWGAITGTWFGVAGIAKQPFFASLIIPRLNNFSDASQNSVIFLCFLVGAVHLSIARLIRTARFINSVLALAEVGWVLVLWGMFFTARTLVLAKPFPHFAGYLFFTGVPLILIFSNPQKNMLKGILSGLGNIPLQVISSFSDIVSYLRLFAVGYASVVVASSFNNMAMEMGFGNVLSGLMAAVILFFGHALNITLGFMAVIVHGIRLNMLEFSGQLGIEWSGKEYNPFRETINGQ
ncbi:MAG: hypothetical protein ABH885_00325 [Candidatus Omnitrophota bacterium]